MNNKLSIALGVWGFLFLGYFTISDLHRSNWAIWIFFMAIVVPHWLYIASSKKIISRLFIVILGSFGLAFLAGNKSYWDFILENILQIIAAVITISTITLATFVIYGFRLLKTSDEILSLRISELSFIYQGRLDIVLQLIKNLPPRLKQSCDATDLVTAMNQFGKIEQVNSIIECLDIIEKRLNKLYLEIYANQNLLNNQTILYLLTKLSADQNKTNGRRIIYNQCANDFNESMTYFPLNILASLSNMIPVKKLKVDIANANIFKV